MGDWWGQPQYGNVTIENNLFGHTVDGGAGGDWHYYGLAWWLTTLDGARVVNNTFENAVSMDRANGGTGGVWANNIGGGWTCEPGVTYAGNVGKACGAQDKAVNPSSSSFNQTAPMGWVNPGRVRLPPHAELTGRRRRQRAVRARDRPRRNGHAPARRTPAHTNTTRGARPRPTRGLQPGLLRIQSVRLRPAVICRHARRGCPRSARLRVVTSRKARVSVRLIRLRSDHRPRRVRTLTIPAARRSVTRVRARGLARGRYRLRITATVGRLALEGRVPLAPRALTQRRPCAL